MGLISNIHDIKIQNLTFRLNWPHGYTELDIKKIESFIEDLLAKVEAKTNEPDTMRKLAYALIALVDNYIKITEKISSETSKLIEELERSV
ncbi:MAG: hypothetical protein NZ870_01910 [bacterium]|nr:hypothetical protein [bacterium]